ncbi:hypothetical protein LguiA_020903 [Lonicera macranthoides]
MAVDFQGREPSLLAGREDSLSDDQNWSSSESGFNGFGSYLNTPVGSELDSTSTETESDEDGFMAELTRQMADYTLEEEEGDGENWRSNGDGLGGPYLKPTGFLSNQHALTDSNQRLPPTHLRNQHVSSISGGRRGKRSESTQQLRTKQQFHPIAAGSGMRAVFLGGTGSRSTSSGTGVFLPRGDNAVAPESRKRTGCSTVLIPARVLQALEVHFNNVDTNGGPNFTPAYKNQHDVVVVGCVRGQQKRQLDNQTRPTMNYDKETQLPQEWTY